MRNKASLTLDPRTPERDPPSPPDGRGRLVYRQSVWTRLTHWAWAVALFFLLLSGLQIFMARPDLYIGRQSGFDFDNAILSISAEVEDGALVGVTDVFGWRFETTGYLGVVDEGGVPAPKTFPGWMTIPSGRDLATGRVVHLFFAWVLVATLAVWLVASLANRHIRRDLALSRDELRRIPREVTSHARLSFRREPRYNPLQKLTYLVILFLVLPLMVLTGLTMSPGVNAWAPWMLDLFGGRQTARTLHFLLMLALLAFFVVHIFMVVFAGPVNEMRSMITGWFRADTEIPHD